MRQLEPKYLPNQMPYSSLVILDLSQNFKVSRDACFYISINRGLINFNDSAKLKFDINDEKKFFLDFKRDISKFFFKIKRNLDKHLSYTDPMEFEFFNPCIKECIRT